MTILLIYNRTR